MKGQGEDKISQNPPKSKNLALKGGWFIKVKAVLAVRERERGPPLGHRSVEVLGKA